MQRMALATTAIAVLGFACTGVYAGSEWEPFQIRDGAGNIPDTVQGRDINPRDAASGVQDTDDAFGPDDEALGTDTSDNPSITEDADGHGVTVDVGSGTNAGLKAGYGTSRFDGQNLSAVPSVNWEREDGHTDEYPYINIWVTDGTNHAILAPYNDGSSEPSRIPGLDIQSLETNVYETELTDSDTDSQKDLDWLHPGANYNSTRPHLEDSNGNKLTIGEITDGLTVGAPSASTLRQQPGTNDIGSGAPRADTGFNIIFGDTAGNFQTDYELDEVIAPEPASLTLLAPAGLLLLRRRRAA